MVALFKSLFRHFKIPNLRALLIANVLCLAPFAAGLGLPFVVGDAGWGLLALIGGFLLTGQALAVSGRVLDGTFRQEPVKVGIGEAWKRGWAEGLVLGVVFVVLFSLAFRSVPYYWALGTPFAWFSLGVLGLGALLFLGGLPFYLPVRRREGLGLFASAARAFRIMNDGPLLTLGGLFLSLLSVLASLGTLGLFPGWAGLAALHQGVYDHRKSALEAR